MIVCCGVDMREGDILFEGLGFHVSHYETSGTKHSPATQVLISVRRSMAKVDYYLYVMPDVVIYRTACQDWTLDTATTIIATAANHE